jgi:hypothetical protein
MHIEKQEAITKEVGRKITVVLTEDELAAIKNVQRNSLGRLDGFTQFATHVGIEAACASHAQILHRLIREIMTAVHRDIL